MQILQLAEGHRIVPLAQRIPLVARHAHLGRKADDLVDDSDRIVQIHGLQARVILIFCGIAEQDEIHVHAVGRQVDPGIELLLNEFSQLLARRRIAFIVLFAVADLYLAVVDLLRHRHGVVVDVCAVNVYLPIQIERIAVLVAPDRDDAGHDVGGVVCDDDALQVLPPPDGYAHIAHLIRHQKDVEVVAHE